MRLCPMHAAGSTRWLLARAIALIGDCSNLDESFHHEGLVRPEVTGRSQGHDLNRPGWPSRAIAFAQSDAPHECPVRQPTPQALHRQSGDSEGRRLVPPSGDRGTPTAAARGVDLRGRSEGRWPLVSESGHGLVAERPADHGMSNAWLCASSRRSQRASIETPAGRAPKRLRERPVADARPRGTGPRGASCAPLPPSRLGAASSRTPDRRP
jgi:hypothetical protein